VHNVPFSNPIEADNEIHCKQLNACGGIPLLGSANEILDRHQPKSENCASHRKQFSFAVILLRHVRSHFMPNETVGLEPVS